MSKKDKINILSKLPSNEKKNHNWSLLIAFLALAVSIISSYHSCTSNKIAKESKDIANEAKEITVESKRYNEKLQSLEKRTEKLYKIAKISQKIESSITYLRMNMPRNTDCQKDYKKMIADGENKMEWIEDNYNYVEKASLDSNALELEKSMPDINSGLIQLEEFPELAKQMVEYCRIHHNHDKDLK